MNGQITREQYDILMKDLSVARVAQRQGGGGKKLSYLESWDVRATLIRVFGFGNFDVHVHDVVHLFERAVKVGSGEGRDGIEVAFSALVTLTIRTAEGIEIASYTEGAVGSEQGSVGFGDLYDNALKTAASDALKRACINLGTQFGLSLYDKGNRKDVVRMTLVAPEKPEYEASYSLAEVRAATTLPENSRWVMLPMEASDEATAAQIAALEQTLGAKQVSGEEDSNEGHVVESDPSVPGQPVQTVSTGDRT